MSLLVTIVAVVVRRRPRNRMNSAPDIFLALFGCYYFLFPTINGQHQQEACPKGQKLSGAILGQTNQLISVKCLDFIAFDCVTNCHWAFSCRESAGWHHFAEGSRSYVAGARTEFNRNVLFYCCTSLATNSVECQWTRKKRYGHRQNILADMESDLRQLSLFHQQNRQNLIIRDIMTHRNQDNDMELRLELCSVRMERSTCDMDQMSISQLRNFRLIVLRSSRSSLLRRTNLEARKQQRLKTMLFRRHISEPPSVATVTGRAIIKETAERAKGEQKQQTWNARSIRRGHNTQGRIVEIKPMEKLESKVRTIKIEQSTKVEPEPRRWLIISDRNIQPSVITKRPIPRGRATLTTLGETGGDFGTSPNPRQQPGFPHALTFGITAAEAKKQKNSFGSRRPIISHQRPLPQIITATNSRTSRRVGSKISIIDEKRPAAKLITSESIDQPVINVKVDEEQCPKPGWQSCIGKREANTRLRQCCSSMPPGCRSLCYYDVNKNVLIATALTGGCSLQNMANVIKCGAAGMDSSQCCTEKGVFRHGRHLCRPFCNPNAGLPRVDLRYMPCLDQLTVITHCFWANLKP